MEVFVCVCEGSVIGTWGTLCGGGKGGYLGKAAEILKAEG